MQALARISSDRNLPEWKYVCKVWPQERTIKQNALDLQLATELGIADHVVFAMERVSRDLMPYIYSACDIYAAPSRLEGFGMPHIEAGACGKPVVSIQAMAMKDTLVHNETALLASIAEENYITGTIVGPDQGFPETHRIQFDPPRIADYRADVGDLEKYLRALFFDPDLRRRLGENGRQRVEKLYNFRVIARKFVEIVGRRLGIE